jgi:hypothetical protein
MIRLEQYRGDFLTSAIVPIVSEETVLDPEEQCAVGDVDGYVKSAVLIGASPEMNFRSNQDMELMRIFDQSPVDCRWPSLHDQWILAKSSTTENRAGLRVIVTRHSNLSNHVEFIFHVLLDGFETPLAPDRLSSIFNLVESYQINRLFIPDILVPDLRSPSAIDRDWRADQSAAFFETLKSGIRGMDNILYFPSLKEFIYISPSPRVQMIGD